jgi:hypothetical protein
MAKKINCLESSCGRGRGVLRSLPLPPRSHSHNSSTSLLEYDSNNSMNETRQTLDIKSLNRSHSHDLLDKNKSISSNESSLYKGAAKSQSHHHQMESLHITLTRLNIILGVQCC